MPMPIFKLQIVSIIGAGSTDDLNQKILDYYLRKC